MERPQQRERPDRQRLRLHLHVVTGRVEADDLAFLPEGFGVIFVGEFIELLLRRTSVNLDQVQKFCQRRDGMSAGGGPRNEGHSCGDGTRGGVVSVSSKPARGAPNTATVTWPAS